ncbi:MAG: hypothetical protein OEW17_04220 [Gemmatimonadota bacterium]|nr:hypothetical protein [Gemmatimonadota bacterium]MDH4347989.1 hypothetical protein [Gemmatimonadota bacterium]
MEGSGFFSTIRGRWRTILVAAVVIPLLLLSLYTWFALHWDYSAGYRSGTLQKFSRKGWLCKTNEGELWQSVVANVSPTVWYFTVREEAVARSLDTMVGRPVRLHYTEHRGVPTSCFGDTPYYVDSVSALTE